ncbi:MAG TPA: sodium:proline symporter, partial [Bacteroidota bacterium]|nr:sodium:proline symporter [Bacteroidota bacterium]
YVFHLDQSNPSDFAYILLITVAITSTVWLSVTFLTKPESDEKLLSFYRRVRPNAGLWGRIAEKATDVVPQRDGFFNLVDWLSGVAMVYSFLFGTGQVILGDTTIGIGFLLLGLVFGGIIYFDLNRRGWETVAE